MGSSFLNEPIVSAAGLRYLAPLLSSAFGLRCRTPLLRSTTGHRYWAPPLGSAVRFRCWARLLGWAPLRSRPTLDGARRSERGAPVFGQVSVRRPPSRCGRFRAKFGRVCANILVEFDRRWAKVRANFGPRPNFDRTWPTLGQIWSKSGQAWSIPGQAWPIGGRIRPTSGQICPVPGRCLSNLADGGPKFGRPTSADLGRSCPEFWTCSARLRSGSTGCGSNSSISTLGRQNMIQFDQIWPDLGQTPACNPIIWTGNPRSGNARFDTLPAHLLCLQPRTEWVNLGFIWGHPLVHLGSIWGQPGGQLGSILVQSWFNLGSIWGRFGGQVGVNVGSTWSQSGVNLRSIRGRCGVDLG